ncbi:hypothetical protein CYMTET_41833 [Cymbomonas tetramitiformis]|uniref:Endonuclease/exonuclease/phosphatase domain-containing protein n=1 Tax=Cymbomonas tetramitiformis TaxID=36881 RepID=A0AAE0F370_9CHLO|nr:hypothetical protein CYMTET_41833 [Cymbomonas tetramitiformis]
MVVGGEIQNPKEMPAPGETLVRDYRDHPETAQERDDGSPVRMLQWNIERGYQYEKIVEELKSIDADIIALQEIDIGCARSGNRDVGDDLARALGMNYVFVTEFEELFSDLREPDAQGGGVHGNGFLTRYDMSDIFVINHKYQIIDWENPQHALAKKEPRHGGRYTLRANFHTPKGEVTCYTVHLEVFCGVLARVQQFSEIFRDCRLQIAKGFTKQAILGDLNTMANGIARFSPHYCCDKMRFWTIGESEGEWWDRNVFSYSSNEQEPSPNPHLLKWGLPKEVARDAVNPHFSDPFDARRDMTLDNPKYRFLGFSLMTGKLDWTLLRHLTVLRLSMGNDDYSASDHKWLLVTVE